jgi:hypothetical protein
MPFLHTLEGIMSTKWERVQMKRDKESKVKGITNVHHEERGGK